jgi:septal ring factor EnvC (AmiA/AmiB activator)
LLKQAGDWVNAGDVIATSGDSGGQPRPALYFEIRSHGKPVNPGNWCTSKVAQLANHG